MPPCRTPTAALLAVMLAAACAVAPAVAPAAGAPPAAAPRTRLGWIGHWLGEDQRETLVREIRRDFEFLHPEYEVDLVFGKELPSQEVDHKRAAAEAIVRMVRTGRIEWDVVFVDVAVHEFVAEMLGDPGWAAKHLVDFAGVPGFLESQEDFIVRDPRYRARFGGIFPGPFIENYLHNPWYNAEVARRAGIAVKERGMTFDDFEGYAAALAAHNRERGTAIPFIKLSSWNRIDALFECLFKSRFDSFAEAVEPRWGERKRRALLDTLLAFERLARHRPAVNPGWEQVSSDDFKRDYLFGDDALFIVGGTFMYSQFVGLDAARSAKMRPVENPHLGRPQGLVGDYTPVFAVMRASPNRAAAVELVMSWTAPRNVEKWIHYTKNLTGSRRHLAAEAALGPSAFDDVYERFIADMEERYRGVPVVHLRTPTYVFGEPSPVSVVELRNALAAILEGKRTARGVLADFERRLPR